ncbi:MAG TPA: complex I subunit 1 family protein [Polyangiaceae bacterium]|nr:complex I subunit 1 family protein [Polyangiaceae bacterium]
MLMFLHQYQTPIFALIKIAIMLGFFLNLAPILVFAERRQSALVQDRIGPNRALVVVPGWALKGALATPALLGAAAAAGLAYGLVTPESPAAPSLGFWLAQLGVLFAWSNVLIIAGMVRAGRVEPGNEFERFLGRMADPRWIFYTGLVAHALLLVAYAALTEPNARVAARAFAVGGPALLVAALVAGAGYLAVRMPNGPVPLRLGGLFHSIADALKLFFKEDFVPPNADKLLHSLAPLVALIPALVTFAVVPFGDTLCFGGPQDTFLDVTKVPSQVPREGGCPGYAVPLQIADLNVGVLYMFAVAGTGIIGSALAGWSSDNKWSLLGGLRAASQMVSYEVAMGLSLVGAFMVYGSPRLGDMARWQGENAWGIFVQPLAFFLFFAAAIAEQKRVPFDAPEGESEIIAGYFVEYSSFKFAMFYTGEYIEMITSSAVLVTIFLGGWNLPFLHRDGISVELGDAVLFAQPMSHLAVTALQVLTFFGKLTLLTFWQIFIRWTLPRFRYDQIMAFGWKFLLPASLANLVLTGVGILLLDRGGPGVQAALKALADLTQWAVVAAVAFVLFRFLRLVLEPAERKKFMASTAAQRAARFGGVKSEPMQA